MPYILTVYLISVAYSMSQDITDELLANMFSQLCINFEGSLIVPRYSMFLDSVAVWRVK
jgi:hypothetical protein